MEIWDGYYEDGMLANVDLIRGNAIPDGLYQEENGCRFCRRMIGIVLQL